MRRARKSRGERGSPMASPRVRLLPAAKGARRTAARTSMKVGSSFGVPGTAAGGQATGVQGVRDT